MGSRVRRVFVSAVALSLVGPAAARAQLAGVVPGYPQVTFNSTSTLSFDAATGSLTIGALPASIRFCPPGAPTPPECELLPIGAPTSFQVSIRVGPTGALLGGDAGGDDLRLEGSATDFFGTAYGSPLLTGEILEFGFLDVPAQNVDYADFRFLVTGGSLAALVPGGVVGVVVTVENSTFTDFGTSFGAIAKGALGPSCYGRIGDFVWEDLDANGVQDALEPGIPNVLLELLDGAGATVLNSTTTDGNGKYLFTKKLVPLSGTGLPLAESGLCAGSYQVRVTPPAGYFPTVTCSSNPADPLFDANCTPATDSNPNPAPVTLPVVVPPATVDDMEDLTIDFGFFRKASLGDFVWKDENGNGIQDAGEPGVPDVQVELYDCGNVHLDTTQTTASGLYLFDQLTPGDYYVKFYPPSGFAFTQRFQGADPAKDSDADLSTGVSACTTLSSGEQDLTLDAGLVLTGPGCIGDFVWLDVNGDGVQDPGEPGFNNFSVWLYRPNGVTTLGETVNGLYLFEDLTPGEYKVCVGSALADYTQTYDLDFPATPHCATITLAAGQCRKDVDFGYAPPVDPGDRVWHDLNGNGRQDSGEPGLNGYTVRLKNAAGVVIETQETTGDGNYGFVVPATGTYTVCVVKPAGYFPTYDLDFPATPNCTTVFVQAGEHRTDVDFGYQKAASIGDRVWNDRDGDGKLDSGEAGLAWVIKLTRPDGTVKKTTATAAGKYSFGNLGPGTYKVCAVRASGYAQTYDIDGVGSANCATVAVGPGQKRTDVDFGYR